MKKLLTWAFSIFFLFIVIFNTVYTPTENSTVAKDQRSDTASASVASTTQQPKITDLTAETYKNEPTIISGSLKVVFLDVGQADSILITADNAAMLIDAGNNADGENVVNYIKSLGIKKLDYVIGTHPHEDHIGGLDNVINNFDIGQIIMPKAQNNTKTFEDVLNAIDNKGLKITAPVPGTKYQLGNSEFIVLAPNGTTYTDLNDYSVVIRLTFGNTSFLFDGDAESKSESEILSKNYNIKSDVLKIGHHGSNSSTSAAYLKAVSPKYAVISVGKDNSYGHPAAETLTKLNNNSIQVFRTDESGAIIATSDGNTIKFDKAASPVKPQAPPAVVAAPPLQPSNTSDLIVYVTDTGEKYHADGCRYLNKSKITISLSEAVKNYSPCSVCHPPTLSSQIVPSGSTSTSVSTNSGSSQTAKKEITVYITRTGSKYHTGGCRYLSKSKIAISLEDARGSYGPCSVCNPPR